MKLAEALSERSDIRSRISQLENRLDMNARVQEGEQPSEDPEALLAELNGLTDRLEELITRINLTNAATICDGEPLTALLARAAERAAGRSGARIRRSEFRSLST